MFSLSGSPGDEAAQRAEVDELAVAEGLGDLAAHRLAAEREREAARQGGA
ncbi:hypothetical protein [Mycobacterium nebraskense]|nr:hypothetical protein [Mycobacterium nebraskense]MBI2694100.1 hypothetical protein [Mycobacterium nebraskense]MCV7119160.1 hypothetical protein [Mycobacterium nebraskense]